MYRLVPGLFLALFSINAASAPQTLRVDYYHSGNNEIEMFSLEQVVLEPLQFSGNLEQPSNLGKWGPENGAGYIFKQMCPAP